MKQLARLVVGAGLIIAGLSVGPGSAQVADPPAPPAPIAQLPQIAPAFRAAELRAVARLRLLSRPSGGCSAILIAAQWALTAAHCSGNGVLPQAANARGLVIAPDAPPPVYRVPATVGWHHPLHDREAPRTTANLGYDIALMRLAAPVPSGIATPLPIAPPMPGAPHAAFGYLNSRDGPLHGQEGCSVTWLSDNLLGTDCRLGGGFSGGGLLRMTAEGWALVGITVAILPRSEGPIRSFIAPVGRGVWEELDQVAIWVGPEAAND